MKPVFTASGMCLASIPHCAEHRCNLQVVALHDVSSTDAAIIYTMEPVLGAAFAYALLGERWGHLGWAGAALIVVSSLAAQILGTENQKKELPAAKR